MSEPPPEALLALEVVQRLRAEGHEALWAGGCVRDRLLGKPPKDYDVATSAPPDAVRSLFGHRRTVPVGVAFGVITVLGPRGVAPVEVATFRSDGVYSDGRRPDAVRFCTAQEDAGRRDFTVNGLFFDPLTETVVDYVGGEADLAAGVVRAIGDPAARFAEDRLRMLRAVRFAASLGFTIDPPTLAAIRQHAEAIHQVSPERIGAEVRRMLTERNPARALRLLAEAELLARVLAPLAAGALVEQAAQRLERLGTASAAARLACCLEEATDETQAAAIARGLRWTRKEWELVAWLVSHRDALDAAPDLPWSVIQPLLAAEGGRDLAALRRARRGEDAAQAYCEARLAWPPERLDPPPLVEGADLLKAGVQPGRELGEMLARSRAAQLDGLAADKPATMRLLGLGV